MTDTIIQSLMRGRLLAAVAGSGVAGGSILELTTTATEEMTAVVNAILGLIAALAAVYSKLRELRRAE